MKFLSTLHFNEEIYQYIGNTRTPILHSLTGITFPDPNYEMYNKCAPNYSIEYVYEGEGAIQQNGFIHKVTRGDFFILHPGTIHHYYSSQKKPFKKIFVTSDCDNSFLDALFKVYKLEDTIYLPQTQTPFCLEEIFELVKNDDGNIHKEFEALMFKLVRDISYYAKNNFDDNKAMNTAKSFIERRIFSKISVKEVADYVNLNQTYFGREFKKTFNQTPEEYILQKKIENASIMLQQSSMTATQIAMALAFTDTAHFSRTFKKITGMTITEYKKQQNS